MKPNFVLAALAIAVAAQAHGEAFATYGVGKGQSKSEVIEVGADHMIINSNTIYSQFEMEDPTHPMNQLKGPCFGVMEVRGGAVNGNGVCVLDGLEGDRVLLGWHAERRDPKGQIHGYWTVNSGSGLWLQASGGGNYVLNVNRANGTATNTLKGAITLR